MLAAPHSERPLLPPGSIAASLEALAGNGIVVAGFRDAAATTIRLSRARGRVECDALAVLFESTITDDRRTVILDVLAAAGTPEAQITMRRLLSLGVARRDSRTFVTFVQRLGFMERPDGATLRFLMSVYAESRHEAAEVRAACAYALGAGTGRAHVWGLTEPAISASEVLRRDLLQATTPAEKRSLLTALGNAGLDSDVGIILRFIEDDDARVRSAAVLALRKMHTHEARASLLVLVAEADTNVAESALSALFEQSLTMDEIVRLAEFVIAGRTAIALDARILRLLATQKLGNAHRGIIEDAVQLLRSRGEGPSLLHGQSDWPSSHGHPREPNNASGYVRRAPMLPHHGEEISAVLRRALPLPSERPSSEPPLATKPRSPETPASPRRSSETVVSNARPDAFESVPMTLDDAQLAALALDLGPATLNDAELASIASSAPPPRRAIPPGAGTVAYGSPSDVIRHLPSGPSRNEGPAEPRPARACDTGVPVIAVRPIVPLAVLR